MESVRSTQRRRFEEDTLPHLEALWSTAQWLTMRRSVAEGLVSRTMTQAYRSWHSSVDPVGSKARLFRIMANEFAGNGNQRHQPGRFLPEHCKTATDSDHGGRRYPTASIDRQELSPLTGIPDVFVKSTITRLRAQSRLIVILLFRERFSYADIAYITDLRSASVRSILGRLRRLIPRYLVSHANSCMAAVDCIPTFGLPRAPSDDTRGGG